MLTGGGPLRHGPWKKQCQGILGDFPLYRVAGVQVNPTYQPLLHQGTRTGVPRSRTCGPHGMYCVLLGFLGIITHKHPLYRAYSSGFPMTGAHVGIEVHPCLSLDNGKQVV